MTAILVEKDPTAYAQLETLPPKFPDIEIKPLHGDFVGLIPTILATIPPAAFAFFLLDPKGWRIPLRALAPMLSRDKSEVIFNFMFEFINRAASIDDPVVVAGLNELLPSGEWRDLLLKAQTSDERKTVLINAFSESLGDLGNYKHICETTILRPGKDRPLYSLFYGTRHDIGLEVFRDCQVKTLEAQATARAATKVDNAKLKTGQSELFGSFHEMSGNEATVFLASERKAATATLLAATPDESSPIRYKNLWPRVLRRHVVRKVDINKLAAELKKQGLLTFPDWEPRKRVPQPEYLVYRSPT
jgi:hypothetical protein